MISHGDLILIKSKKKQKMVKKNEKILQEND